MNVRFYKCNSDKENITKDIDLLMDSQGNVIGDYDGFLREESSITDPVIRIETLDSGEEFPWARVNYMFIPSWGRYYYITDIVVVRTHLYEISAHVDVLMSFRTELLNCSGIIQNAENKWNMYLDDGTCKVYQNPVIKEYKFPTAFPEGKYLLAVSGTGSSS